MCKLEFSAWRPAYTGSMCVCVYVCVRVFILCARPGCALFVFRIVGNFSCVVKTRMKYDADRTRVRANEAPDSLVWFTNGVTRGRNQSVEVGARSTESW